MGVWDSVRCKPWVSGTVWAVNGGSLGQCMAVNGGSLGQCVYYAGTVNGE